MRKFFLFVLLISMMLFPTLTQAQGNVKIGELTIQLWPEYDHPEMLVMYSLTLSADSALPAEMQVSIPANADLNAVAKVEDGTMVNIPYDAPVKDGDSVLITFLMDDLSSYRVEYYAPIEKDGSKRSYNLVWPAGYTIDSFLVQFQQPPTSTNFTSTPVLPNISPVSGGITYHDLDIGGLAGDSNFTWSVSYQKENDDLTVSAMPIEAGGGTLPETNEIPNSFSLSDALPFILVGIGILLIAGGLLYFFTAGRRDTARESGRKRHSPSTAAAGGNIYCHECGSRASSSDKFCRSCGVKLRS